MRREDAAGLARLGIRSDSLAGRLRLVLTIGCYRDFRFMRDILSTSARPEQVELAIEARTDLVTALPAIGLIVGGLIGFAVLSFAALHRKKSAAI